jgi:hypothetical protein
VISPARVRAFSRFLPVGTEKGTVNLLKLSGGTGMVGSGGSVCVAWVRPLCG